MAEKSKALGAGRSAGKTATGHLERRAAVKAILGDTSSEDILFITGLAGSKNDVLEAVGPDSKRIYPLFGAMRAATGMALGLALIHHIFSNDLHDLEFCVQWVEGWERWRGRDRRPTEGSW